MNESISVLSLSPSFFFFLSRQRRIELIFGGAWKIVSRAGFLPVVAKNKAFKEVEEELKNIHLVLLLFIKIRLAPTDKKSSF